VTKIICTLPPSYENVLDAWDNMLIANRNLNNPNARLLKKEALRNTWGILDDNIDKTFFRKYVCCKNIPTSSRAKLLKTKGKNMCNIYCRFKQEVMQQMS
jgi:hypothetical protein